MSSSSTGVEDLLSFVDLHELTEIEQEFRIADNIKLVEWVDTHKEEATRLLEEAFLQTKLETMIARSAARTEFLRVKADNNRTRFLKHMRKLADHNNPSIKESMRGPKRTITKSSQY